jgi:hypothetical protein
MLVLGNAGTQAAELVFSAANRPYWTSNHAEARMLLRQSATIEPVAFHREFHERSICPIHGSQIADDATISDSNSEFPQREVTLNVIHFRELPMGLINIDWLLPLRRLVAVVGISMDADSLLLQLTTVQAHLDLLLQRECDVQKNCHEADSRFFVSNQSIRVIVLGIADKSSVPVDAKSTLKAAVAKVFPSDRVEVLEICAGHADDRALWRVLHSRLYHEALRVCDETENAHIDLACSEDASRHSTCMLASIFTECDLTSGLCIPMSEAAVLQIISGKLINLLAQTGTGTETREELFLFARQVLIASQNWEYILKSTWNRFTMYTILPLTCIARVLSSWQLGNKDNSRSSTIAPPCDWIELWLETQELGGYCDVHTIQRIVHPDVLPFLFWIGVARMCSAEPLLSLQTSHELSAVLSGHLRLLRYFRRPITVLPPTRSIVATAHACGPYRILLPIAFTDFASTNEHLAGPRMFPLAFDGHYTILCKMNGVSMIIKADHETWNLHFVAIQASVKSCRSAIGVIAKEIQTCLMQRTSCILPPFELSFNFP